MKYLFFVCCTCITLSLNAQDVSLALQKSVVADTQTINAEWHKLGQGINLSFVSSNIRYTKELPPKVQPNMNWSAKAWKGEKIHAQLLVWADNNQGKISVQVGDLKNEGGHILKKENITVGFIRYVITDEFKNGCGHRKAKDYDSSYVADLIDANTASVLQKNTTQPIWLSIKVPENINQGIYKGSIKVIGKKTTVLPIRVQVLNKTLPAPSKWKHDLDLWQHPAAIARVHQVPLWSDRHFELMKSYYKMLANAGQKTITASIVDEPWGHQTYDDYPSLIKWTKKKDGTWKYDYQFFDEYVAFVMATGINRQINCYSMVPWKIAFTYFDENLQKEVVFKDAIGTPQYNDFWKPMLIDFARHLKQKGWFNKTYIAMDERPMPAMKAVIELLKSVDQNWKIALAGEYHDEIEADIDNYCIASKWDFPEPVLQKRKNEGKISTWYTCCTEPYPNGFTFSSPAESVWLGWYTARKNMDGYLRWAYNSWTKNPLTDTRFTAWPAGDTYQIYPGPLTSVRFEKLIEGIQDFEKIQHLKSIYAKNKQFAKLAELNKALEIFDIKELANTTATDMLNKVKHLLND